jgi:hypothetical protein
MDTEGGLARKGVRRVIKVTVEMDVLAFIVVLLTAIALLTLAIH